MYQTPNISDLSSSSSFDDYNSVDYLSVPNPTSRSNNASSFDSIEGSHHPDDPFAPKPIDFTMMLPKRQGDYGSSSQAPAKSGDYSQLAQNLFEDPQQKKSRRRNRRRARMAAGGVGGLVVGGVLLGPVGACAGCVSVAAISRAASKVGEKRKDSRLQKEIDSHTILV